MTEVWTIVTDRIYEFEDDGYFCKDRLECDNFFDSKETALEYCCTLARKEIDKALEDGTFSEDPEAVKTENHVYVDLCYSKVYFKPKKLTAS